MKKAIIPFAAFALMAVSCAKDYACVCTTLGETDTTPTIVKKVTKRWMKNEYGCVSYTDVSDGVSVETTCEIEKK
jgi:hypothetical protein